MITKRQEKASPKTAPQEVSGEASRETPGAVTGESLARQTAERAGIDLASTQKVLGAFVETLQERLLNGDRVALGDLVDLGVVREPARIRRDPSGRFSEIAPARSRLDVQPGQTLDESLALQRAAGILLVMPAENRFAEMLGEHFARLGWQVQRAVDAAACRTMLEGPNPYLLVCDHTLPDRDALVHRVKTNWRTNTVPVVSMHTRFEELKRPDGLLVLADMAVFEPIAVGPFLRSMDQLLAQSTEEAAVFERQLRFRVPIRERELSRAFELGDSFFKDAGFRGEALVGLTTAYREAIRNAEVHGSGGDESLTMDIEFLLDAKKVTISVEDEGDGFDHRAYFSQLNGTEPVAMARERHAQGGVGGLGIYLMARCADRISYNDAGNRVTLTRKREAAE